MTTWADVAHSYVVHMFDRVSYCVEAVEELVKRGEVVTPERIVDYVLREVLERQGELSDGEQMEVVRAAVLLENLGCIDHYRGVITRMQPPLPEGVVEGELDGDLEDLQAETGSSDEPD
jgi:hypothetical protein